MALPIRQGATHKVLIGPVVAVGDGFVPITNLAISSSDEAEVILHDNGTVVDISGYTFAAITTADGYYHLTLQTGISNTVGHMTVVINDDSLCLPVKADFVVLDTGIYDSIYADGAASLATEAKQDIIDTNVDDIETDTNELQGDWANGGRLDLLLDLVATTADLLDKLGAVNEAAAAGDPSATESVMQYVKQIVNVLMGTTGIVAMPAAAAPANNVSIAEMVRSIYDDSNSLDGTKIPDTLSLANINAEVVDVLKTDTVTLPGQTAPPLTPTFEEMISWLYKNLRNRKDQTSTLWQLYADNESTVDAKATVSDDGTTAIKQEIVTGP